MGQLCPVIRCSQHEFMKGWSHLTNLISYDKMTFLVDEGKAVDVIYLNFSKVFDSIPQYSVRNWLLTAWTGVQTAG